MTKQSQTGKFPPVPTVFKEAFDLLVKHLFQVIMLFLISMVPFVALVIVGGIVGVSLMTGYDSVNSFMLDFITNTSIQHLIGWISGMVVLGFLSFAFSVLIRISFIEILGEVKGNQTVREALRNGIYLIAPYIFLTILISLLNTGALVLLVIPALLFTFLLQFSFYELIFEKQRWTQALRGSYRIVSQNFGQILISLLAYYIGLFIIIYLLPEIVTNVDETIGALFAVFMVFIQMLVGWYGVAFHIVLYKYASAATDRSKPVSIAFMYVIALLGWIIIMAGGYYGYTQVQDTITSFSFDKDTRAKIVENVKRNLMTDIAADERIESYIPTECGISLPVLDTSTVEDEQGRKWVVNDGILAPEDFYILDEDVHPRDEGVLTSYTYKPSDAGFRDEDNTLYPGMYMRCIENNQGLSINNYVDMVSVNQDFTVEPFANGWRNVKARGLLLKDAEGRNEPAYLLIDENHNRVIHITLWGIPEDTVDFERIEADYQLITTNLSYNDVTPEITLPTSTQPTTPPKAAAPAKPSCVQYNIREGEFASNKCYSQADYDDLRYYLSQYNSAVFDYNSAGSTMEVTCTGSDFFKSQCDQATERRSQAENDLNTYKGTIHGIIGKGK